MGLDEEQMKAKTAGHLSDTVWTEGSSDDNAVGSGSQSVASSSVCAGI